MKVCMVVPYFPPVFSGAGQLVYDFGRLLPEQGVDVRIVALDTGGLPREEWMAGMHIERIRPRLTGRLQHPFFMMQLAWYLWRRRREFQVLHLHGAYFPLFGVVPLIRWLGKKTVLTFHDPEGDMPELIPKRTLGALQIRFLTAMDRFVHTTSFVSDSYGRTSLPKEKLRRIPCGIDVDQRFLPMGPAGKAALRRDRGLAAEAKIAVFTGAVIPRKGVDTLVEAWQGVVASCPEALLLVLGPLDAVEDPQEADFVDQLKHRITRLGLQQSVRLMGRTEDVECYLQLADIFVFPSRRETFGIALIEAMACGLPCVVSTIQGVSTDIIDHQRDGWLVEQENPQAFAEAVVQLLRDPVMSEELGQRAAEKVRQEFSIASVSRQHHDLYEELLS